MKPTTTRSLLWLLAALASLTLALGIHEAAKRSDPTSALVVTILVEAVAGIASFVVFTTRRPEPAAHTRGRWSSLDAIRSVAAVLVYGFLIGLLVATFAFVALANPWLQLALLAPALAGTLCLVGAFMERESVAPARHSTVHASVATRKVYETRTGAVVVEDHDGHQQVVLTGPNGRRDVDAVEHEIDSRGWREGEMPASTELTEALQRWGVLRGNTE